MPTEKDKSKKTTRHKFNLEVFQGSLVVLTPHNNLPSPPQAQAPKAAVNGYQLGFAPNLCDLWCARKAWLIERTL